MNRIAVGVLVGGVLGILDGLTAWFTPLVGDLAIAIHVAPRWRYLPHGRSPPHL